MLNLAALFTVGSAVCLLLYLFIENSKKQSTGGVEFRRFQRTYLAVYLMAQGIMLIYFATDIFFHTKTTFSLKVEHLRI